MMRLFLLLSILLSVSSSYAREDEHNALTAAINSNDADRVLRAARDLYRQQRRQEREAASALVPVQKEQGVCVECENLLGLTDEVTKILNELGEAPEEVEQLAVVSSYVRTVHVSGEVGCEQMFDDRFTPEFSQPDLNSAVLIYSGEMNLDHLDYWKISRARMSDRLIVGDTYFLRGRGDDKNIFIRLDKNKEDPTLPPRVTIFRLENISADEKIYETKKKREAENPLPDIEDKSSSSWRPWWQKKGEYDGSYDLSPGPDTSLKFGPRLEMKDYLPNNITILDFRTKQNVSENFDLQVEGEVSSDRQEARFALQGRHGEGERVWLAVRPGGDYDVGMPYSFSFSEASIRGSIIANEDGAGASMVIDERDNSSTNARYFNQGGDSTYEVDHNRRIAAKTYMTFRVSKDTSEEKVWLMFRYALD